jgi:hypothetical protein
VNYQTIHLRELCLWFTFSLAEPLPDKRVSSLSTCRDEIIKDFKDAKKMSLFKNSNNLYIGCIHGILMQARLKSIKIFYFVTFVPSLCALW